MNALDKPEAFLRSITARLPYPNLFGAWIPTQDLRRLRVDITQYVTHTHQENAEALVKLAAHSRSANNTYIALLNAAILFLGSICVFSLITTYVLLDPFQLKVATTVFLWTAFFCYKILEKISRLIDVNLIFEFIQQIDGPYSTS